MWEKVIFGGWHTRMAKSVMRAHPLLCESWSYDYGVVLNGMRALYELTGERGYFEYIRACMDAFVGESGDIKGYFAEEQNLDYINNGKILLYLYEATGEARWRSASDRLFAQLLSQPRTPEGGFWHKKIYPNQMWLDGLYMAEPFYAGYAKLTGKHELFDDIARQFTLSYERTRDESTGLCRHAWDSAHAQPWADKSGRAPHCWGRALGWYIAAMVDTLPYFPENHAGREAILRILRALAEALTRARDSVTGVWYQVPDQISRPGNYPEASASCLITYALLKGARLGYLGGDCASVGRDAYRGIITQFVELMKGAAQLNKTCQVGGLGGASERDGSFAYYISEPIITGDLKGVGAFIQCACETEGYLSSSV